jgi:hypothetical protein
MFYTGQTVFSNSLEIPGIYVGRRYIEVGDKKYEWKYCVFLDTEYEDDWEYHDLMPLISTHGNVFLGPFSTRMITGIRSQDFLKKNKTKIINHLEDVKDKIKENKFTILNLNADD